MKTQKQRIFSILAILTMAVILTCIFAACDKTGAQDSSFRVTIHPNNGQSDIVWDIATDIPSITKDGYHIVGYYLNAELTISISLESLKATGLTKNVDVYVKWEKNVCEHSEVIDNAVDPTCTTSGLTQGKHCSICGEILQKQIVVDALGHDFEHLEAKAATCTEIGWNAYDACKRAGCDYTTYQEIPALGHKYSQDWSNDKTYHWHASTCGHDVVSDKEEHTFDSNWVCTECEYVDTGLHGVELRTNTLEFDGTDIFGKVSNATSTFSFINEISIADSASYIVSTDINGSNVIRTKTVSLSIGDNTFYILVENGKDLGLYTVVIRRRPMYSISFNVNGGTSVSSQTIEEDYFATEPTTERKGYTFDKWDYDFSEPIIKDTTITASWQVINYPIIYELNGGKNSSDNPTTYTIEDRIVLVLPTKTGYSGVWSNNGQIEKGSTGQKLFTATYTINQYNVCVKAESSNCKVEGGGTFDYNSQIILSATEYRGYEFIGWYNGDTLISKENQHVFIVPENDCELTARIALKEEMSNYTFSSTIENCVIIDTNNKSITTLTIPEYVTDIGQRAFANCTEITSVTINNGLKSIGTAAFCDCAKITSIVIPNGVTSIGNSAFTGCTKLKNIIIPESVVSIGKSAFERCVNLSNITLPNNVSTIENNTFHGCSELKSVTLPNGLINIGNYAFGGCKNLISIVIPSKVKTIGEDAFYSCFKLVEIINNSSLSIVRGSTSYGYIGCYALNIKSEGNSDIVNKDGFLMYSITDRNYLLGYTGEIISALTLPENYNGNSYQIYNYAFYNQKGLTSVTISNGVTEIGEYAFAECNKLSGINFTEHIKTIGDFAFMNCTGIINIEIPSNVSSIGKSAFSGCSELVNVTINNGLKSIGGNAFYGCAKIKKILIPDSVTSIEGYAFYGCSNLITAKLPKNITRIPNYTFAHCNALTNISVPDSVVSIDDGAFFECNSLSSLNIPDGVMNIGSYAFYNCYSLSNTTIPNGVKNIGDFAFGGCNKLKNIIIPESVESIGFSSFSGCSSLESITIPFVGTKAGVTRNDTGQYPLGYIFGSTDYVGGVATTQYYYKYSVSSLSNDTYYIPASLRSVLVMGGDILYGAFYSCNSLTSVTIGSGVGSICDHAFYNCKGLSIVDIENGVTSIGSSVFWNCDKLESIIIPESVLSIENSAFSNSGIIDITISNGTTKIGAYAFSNCTKLMSISIPDSLKELGEGAFMSCNALKDITFEGTVEQWNAIIKGNSWNYGVATDCTITCSDGTI